MEKVWGLYSYAQYTRRFSLHVFLYVSGRFNVVKNHLPSIHMYADDIQLYLSFMTLSTSPQHGALRAIQASVSDKNSWDPSTQHCFYFWPVSWSSQCWLSHLTHHQEGKQWKCGGGGGEKAIEMWRWWWWWRETG